MQVSSINFHSPVGLKKISSPNFKGLWGKEEVETRDNRVWSDAYECDFGELENITVKHYYPFLDETDEDIKKVKSQEFIKKTESGDSEAVTYIDSLQVYVMPTIPITAKEYNAYIARELLSKEEMEVEDKLKKAKLQMFLR